MDQIKVIKIFLIFLFVFQMANLGLAQEPKERFQQMGEKAWAAFQQKDFSATVELFTEAINLFPKLDAFTPKNKKLYAGNGKFIETPYVGLESFYWLRGIAYLNKGNIEQAENDFANALNVVKTEYSKKLAEAKSFRNSADIKKEKSLPYNSFDNSNLFKAATSFQRALPICEKAKRLNLGRKLNYEKLSITIPLNLPNISGFEEIASCGEESLFGSAEAYTTLVKEVGNVNHTFMALKTLNEFIAAYPDNIKAYQLRAKIHSQMGRMDFAAADEKKIKELSVQK
jgi:tetratricopeptide (TPR) repeat protein